MKTLFLNLQDFITLNLPNVAHIDLWNNQLSNLDVENPIAWPAVFVEYMPVTWTRQMGAKKGDLSVKIHFVQETYCSTFAGSVNQTDALSILDRAEEVEDMLEDFAGESASAFVGVSTEVDNNHDMLIDTIIEYSTTITRSIGKRRLVQVSPDLKIIADIEK